MRKLGKKYVEASNKVEKNKTYDIEEAIKLVKETSITKFDSSVEVANGSRRNKESTGQ